MDEITILALAGSYRSGSYNQALLAATREEAAGKAQIVDFDLRTVPYYDGDVEAEGDPGPVAALKDAVRGADALLIVTPEYNGGVPGVLKNGLDWASRKYPNAPISGKLCALMGATPGRSGTRSAQEQLCALLQRVNAVPIDTEPIMVARAGSVIKDGVVTSAELRAQVASLVDAILETIRACEETGSAAVAGTATR